MRRNSREAGRSAGGRSQGRRDPQVAREEALRPCPLLGYDRDQLGAYLLERGAFELAETQFHRAAWLNPDEPLFRVHWAAALARLNRKAEARQLLSDILADDPKRADARDLWRQVWPGDGAPGSPDEPGASGADTPHPGEAP
jgi:tetratricopeptide (TPR) repeat protein